MAATAPLPDLLLALTDSLIIAASSFPVPSDSLDPPADGISLLNTKNDLLLSYLQNLVFLFILKLRDGVNGQNKDGAIFATGIEAIQRLVQLRAYLERGVRPLEGRLRYQIEKVLRAADDAERSTLHRGKGSKLHQASTTNGKKATTEGSDTTRSDMESASSDDSIISNEVRDAKIDDLSYRPNPSALLRKPEPSEPSRSNSSKTSSALSGAYKPPRIAPTAMPDPSSANTKGTSTSRSALRTHKSHLLEEYISTELSSAPHAEPSLGSNSTILNRGRGALSARDREKERQRTEYEESNFSRLPRESKAERRKNRGRLAGEGGRDKFGGEDWTVLGEMGDRVARAVGRRHGGVKGSVLERREKRQREGGDVGGVSLGIGESFEKRRKVLEGRAERKRKTR